MKENQVANEAIPETKKGTLVAHSPPEHTIVGDN